MELFDEINNFVLHGIDLIVFGENGKRENNIIMSDLKTFMEEVSIKSSCFLSFYLNY
jgi:hypothetical protein